MTNYRYYNEFNFITQIDQPKKHVKISYKKSDNILYEVYQDLIKEYHQGKKRIRIANHCYNIQKVDDESIYLIKL